MNQRIVKDEENNFKKNYILYNKYFTDNNLVDRDIISYYNDIGLTFKGVKIIPGISIAKQAIDIPESELRLDFNIGSGLGLLAFFPTYKIGKYEVYNYLKFNGIQHNSTKLINFKTNNADNHTALYTDIDYKSYTNIYNNIYIGSVVNLRYKSTSALDDINKNEVIGYPFSYSVGFSLSYYVPNFGVDIDITPSIFTNYDDTVANLNIYLGF